MKLIEVISLSGLVVFGYAETTRYVPSGTTARGNSFYRRTAVSETTDVDILLEPDGGHDGSYMTLSGKGKGSMDVPSAAPSAAPTFMGACCFCDGKKSYVPVADALTMDEHIIAARAMGCDLVSIADGGEQAGVMAAAATLGGCAFIGLTRDAIAGQVASPDEDDGWFWIDGCEPYMYDDPMTVGVTTFWATGEPSTAEHTGVCIDSASGEWMGASIYDPLPAVYECCIPDRTEMQCEVDLVAPTIM